MSKPVAFEVCPGCDRWLRPKGTTAVQYPNTVLCASMGLCKTCWREAYHPLSEEREAKKRRAMEWQSRKPTEDDLLVDRWIETKTDDPTVATQIRDMLGLPLALLIMGLQEKELVKR